MKFFRSANKFPQFEGKSSEYINSCLNYVRGKSSGLKYYFWIAAVLIFGFCILINGLFLDNLLAQLAVGLCSGLAFYLYLLWDINKLTYPLVLKYIEEFEQQDHGGSKT
ncbi:hypothetical protein [Arenicella xantha]|uniref:Uncharacterized protein n=1 Tax=Arenicella xantha TaxID=644221 RepID=A0A395JHG1_9GAMM|nr:hypothetical protein [Arenicella xantha]RBP44829.1 hypothetical protein DFR28_1234 [Arenicella xantha]